MTVSVYSNLSESGIFDIVTSVETEDEERLLKLHKNGPRAKTHRNGEVALSELQSVVNNDEVLRILASNADERVLVLKAFYTRTWFHRDRIRGENFKSCGVVASITRHMTNFNFTEQCEQSTDYYK